MTGNGNYGIAGQQWVPPLRAAGLTPAASFPFGRSGVRRRRLASLRFASYVQAPSWLCHGILLRRGRGPRRTIVFPRFRRIMTRGISTAVLPRIRRYHDVSQASAVVKSSATTMDFYVQTPTPTGGDEASVKAPCLGLCCVSQSQEPLSNPTFYRSPVLPV